MSDTIQIIDNTTQEVVDIVDNGITIFQLNPDFRGDVLAITSQGFNVEWLNDLGTSGNDWIFTSLYCYDAQGRFVFFTISNKTEKGFTIIPDADCTLEYKAELIKDSTRQILEEITSDGFTYTFPIAFASADDYILSPYCYDSQGRFVFFTLTSKTRTRFTIIPDADCTLNLKISRK